MYLNFGAVLNDEYAPCDRMKRCGGRYGQVDSAPKGRSPGGGGPGASIAWFRRGIRGSGSDIPAATPTPTGKTSLGVSVF